MRVPFGPASVWQSPPRDWVLLPSRSKAMPSALAPRNQADGGRAAVLPGQQSRHLGTGLLILTHADLSGIHWGRSRFLVPRTMEPFAKERGLLPRGEEVRGWRR